MNFELFIAKKIIKSNSGTTRGTKPIVKIATFGISIGLAVMILSSAIVTGFQTQIRNKVIGFGSHIQVTSFDSNNSIEAQPINKNQPFYPHIDTVNGIHHIQYYANKAGILKKEENIHGVILKGVGPDYNWSFFSENIIEGSTLQLSDSLKSNETVISTSIADALNLQLGDKITAYFIQDPPRVRKFEIVGIYETGMEKFDDHYILIDIQHIQKLNQWSADQISGFEILLDDYSQLEHIDQFIYENIGYELNTTKITDRHREIFNWLELQDWNVVIIITLMILVAGINMISALLILILERTNMIGLLKALGIQNISIRKIFLYNAAYLIIQGLFFGNLIGLGICFIQSHFGWIKLPKESYYISEVPINLTIQNVLILNLGTFILCLLMLIIPSYIVTKITPVKAIRFN